MGLTLDPDEHVAFSAVLRARPANLGELARQVPLDDERLSRAVRSLADRGMFLLDGERIEVLAPDETTVATASRLLARQSDELAELGMLLEQLPALSRDWRMGVDTGESVPVEVVHGTARQWDLWMRLMGQTPPRAPIAVFPDFGGLATIVIQNIDALRHARHSLGFSIRTITTAEALADDRHREQIATMAEVGIETRTLPEVPGWFYVDDGVLAALPLEWGQAVPSSIALVRDPAVLAPLVAYMESLWRRSNPIPGSVVEWDPVLGLLAQGLSDGAIASALGSSVRTIRRRIAEAAEAHGAASRFALGVEWERRRTR